MTDVETKPIHVWVNPPNTPLPLTASPVRVAIGTPRGQSSNSWRLWVQGEDIYVKCRDDFRELKASLHASGIWRFGFTEEFVRSQPSILPVGKDRAWRKWKPDLADPQKPVIGFQILGLRRALYLVRKKRESWPDSVVFVEPPSETDRMTVLSVTVVHSRTALKMGPGVQGAVAAVLPLGDDRTVQLVATHDELGDVEARIEEAFNRAVQQVRETGPLPDEGIFFVNGNRGEDIPWVTAVPFRQAV